jgi:uncharacterized protein YxjI
MFGSLKAIGTIKNRNGTSAQLKMKSGMFDRKAEIKNAATGKAIASIHRRFVNARELGFGKQTYGVNIEPGVNMANIVAMCICLDEMRDDSKK